jgi:hypothetical protein
MLSLSSRSWHMVHRAVRHDPICPAMVITEIRGQELQRSTSFRKKADFIWRVRQGRLSTPRHMLAG